MPALLRRIGKSIQNPVTDLVSSRTRERLAGRTASEQFYVSILNELPDPHNEFGVAKVPVECQPSKVVPMRLCCFPVTVVPSTTR